jgi:hypothetical protein
MTMPELSFKEWVEQKDEEARGSERGQRRAEWIQAYRRLRAQIEHWLREDGGERIQIDDEVVQRNERGLGIYNIDGFRIRIGDSSAHVVPVSRNVIARINPPGGGEFPGEGLVDITSGGRKYHLYRTVQDGTDVWYVVEEKQYPLRDRSRDTTTPLTREILQEILMDLMS